MIDDVMPFLNYYCLSHQFQVREKKLNRLKNEILNTKRAYLIIT